MPQQNKLSHYATTVSTIGKTTIIKFHQTNIVEFDNELIYLNTGGWYTPTTKTRMNQASNQFNLGYHVHQKNFEWYIHITTPDGLIGRQIPFYDGMIINRKTLTEVKTP